MHTNTKYKAQTVLSPTKPQKAGLADLLVYHSPSTVAFAFGHGSLEPLAKTGAAALASADELAACARAATARLCSDRVLPSCKTAPGKALLLPGAWTAAETGEATLATGWNGRQKEAAGITVLLGKTHSNAWTDGRAADTGTGPSMPNSRMTCPATSP